MGTGGPGEGGLLDPDGALERLTAWKGRIDRMAADTAAMSERLHDLRETVADANRIVEVTVDSTGALVDLRLTERVQRVAPDVVARTILDTIGEAKARIAARAQEVIGDALGPDSVAARTITERVGQQLRGAEPDAGPGEQGAAGRKRSW